MERFDINEVISRYNLDADKLAIIFFPRAKFPRKALNRVLRYETLPDTSQVERLALYLGVPVGDLYTIDKWSLRGGGGSLSFVQGEYIARVNLEGSYVLLNKGNIEVARYVVKGLPDMSASEFMKKLNSLIKQHENGKSENYIGA